MKINGLACLVIVVILFTLSVLAPPFFGQPFLTVALIVAVVPLVFDNEKVKK